MGNCCNQSSGNQQEMKLYMEQTGYYEINELFYSVAAPLKTLEEVNKSLSPEDLQKATFTHVIKQVTLIDAIRGMLYSYSAETDGDLKKISLSFTNDHPYIGVDRGSLPLALRPISDTWDALMIGLQTATDKLQPLPDQLQLAIEESKEIPSRAKDICTTQNLGFKEIYDVTQKVSANVSTIANSKNILTQTYQTIDLYKETLKTLPSVFNEEELKSIEDIGKKAKAENANTPKLIITKFWPEPARIDLSKVAP